MLMRQTGPLIDITRMYDAWHEATDKMMGQDDFDDTDFTVFGGRFVFHEDLTIGTTALIYGHAALTMFMIDAGRGWDVEVKFDARHPIKRIPPNELTPET